MGPESRPNANSIAYDEDRDTLQRMSLTGAANMNLEHALSAVLDAFAIRCDIRLRVFVKGQPRCLRADAQAEIYLIGRDAMVNAIEADATDVETEVEYLPRRLRVVIRDNGRGIDPESIRSGEAHHWGLVGMRERAEKIGAQLRVWSRRGAGTEVEISVPREIAVGAWA